jgi:AraC-like DNA-binding protein
MRKPPKLPPARDMLYEVITSGLIPRTQCRVLKQVLILMYRDTAVRRAPAKRIVIDKAMRKKIFRLANTDLNMNQIAKEVGLQNQGRISEVLTGQR